MSCDADKSNALGANVAEMPSYEGCSIDACDLMAVLSGDGPPD